MRRPKNKDERRDETSTATLSPGEDVRANDEQSDESDRIPDVIVHLNLALLLWTVAIAAVCLLAVHFGRGYQLRKNAQHVRQMAEDAEAEGDVETAIKQWTRYLGFQRGQTTPGSESPLTETLLRLGKLSGDRADSNDDVRQAFGDYQRAYNYLEEALREEPERHAERARLVDVCVKLGRHPDRIGSNRDAIEHLKRLLREVPEKANDPKLLLDLAQAQFALRKFPAVQKSYARLIASNPSDCAPYLELTRLIVQQPKALCTQQELCDAGRDDIELVAPDAGSFVLSAFPTEGSASPAAASPRSALHTVDALLNLLVELGQPSVEAHRERALFLASIPSTLDDSPMDMATAKSRVDNLFAAENSADQDGDGVLSREEARMASVPPFSDFNRDGRIDRDELQESFTRGGLLNRLELAEQSVQEVLALIDTVDDQQTQTDMFTAATEVYSAFAEALVYEDHSRAVTYFQLAHDAAERAVAASSQSPESLLALAQLELQSLQVETTDVARQLRMAEAEKLVRRVRDTLTSDATSQEAEAGSHDRFRVEAELTLGRLLLAQAQTAQAGEAESLKSEIRKEIIPALESQKISIGDARFLKGALLLLEQHWREAEQTLRSALTEIGLNASLTRQVALLRAECARRLGDTDTQIARILAVHRAEPDRPDGRLALAAAYAGADNIDASLAEYGRYRANPLITPRYISLLITRQLRKPIEDRTWEELDVPLQALAGQEENASQVPILRAEVLYWQAYSAQLAQLQKGGDELAEAASAKLKEAYDILAAGVEAFPNDLDIRVALSDFVVRRFDLTPAQRAASCDEILRTALEVVGDDVKLRVAAAQAARLLPKAEALSALADLKTKENPAFTAADRATILEAVANVYFAHGERATAIADYVAAARQLPTEIRFPQAALQLIVGHIIENNGKLGDQQANWNEMLTQLKAIETGGKVVQNIDSPYSSYYRAAAIVLQAPVDTESLKQLNDAQTLLRDAQRARPKWSAVPRMLGELATLQHVQAQQAGDVSHFQEAAVAHFEDAVELGDYDESIVGRVVEYYMQNGREGDATRLLEIVSRNRPQSITGRLAALAWTLERRLGEKNAALDKYIASAEAANGRAADKIRSAYVLLSRGDAGPKTEELLREACELEPTLPGPWEHLVRYLASRRRIDEARDQIDEAEQALPDDPAELKPRTLAHCFQLLRNSDPTAPQKWAEQAERYYRAAIGAAPKNIALQQELTEFYMEGGQLDLAGETIKTILDPSSGASPQARDWALTHQALIAGSTGDPLAALGTLKTAKPADELGRIANLRAQLAIYTQRNLAIDQADMRAALEDLHKLTSGRLTPRERLQLATISRSEGNWQRAHEIYREWIDSAPRDPGPHALLAESLIRHADSDSQNIADARAHWETLRSLEPDTYRTHTLEARLAAAEGRPDEAAAQLSEFVTKFADVKLDDVFVKVQQAQTAEEAIKLLSEARALLSDPTVTTELAKAQQLQKSGDGEQALETLHRLANAQAAVINVRKESLHNAAGLLEELGELEAAEQLFARFSEQSPQVDAPLELARFLARHDRVDEALDLCRTHWDDIPPETVGGLVASLFRASGTTDPAVVRPFFEKLEKSVDLAPDDNARINRLFELANFHDLQQNYDAAEAAYSRIIQIKPDEVVSANNLAFLWARRGKNLPQALELIDHQIKAFGQGAELLDTKAVVLLSAGRAAEAAELLKGVTDKAPGALYYLHQAEAQSAAGQRLEAKQSLKKAADLGLTEKDLHPFDLAAYHALQKKLGG